MILQNQMTFGDFKKCLNELTTRVDSATSLVEGMEVGPIPHYKGPPTVPSVIGRLVDPIGEQHPVVHRLSRTGQPAMHAMSLHGPKASPVSPVVLQMSVTYPHRGNAPFLSVFRPPEPVAGNFFRMSIRPAIARSPKGQMKLGCVHAERRTQNAGIKMLLGAGYRQGCGPRPST